MNPSFEYCSITKSLEKNDTTEIWFGNGNGFSVTPIGNVYDNYRFQMKKLAGNFVVYKITKIFIFNKVFKFLILQTALYRNLKKYHRELRDAVKKNFGGARL